MVKLAARFAAVLFVFMSTQPVFAQAEGVAVVLYEDQATGQLFTKPGEGRLPVDAEKQLGIPKAALSNLYTDENGLLFTKPAEGRTRLAEPEVVATATPTPEPLKKEEVLEVLPDWMQRIKLGGDLRLRYQYEDKEGDASDARHRARYRFRVGADAKVTKTVEVGLGLASGENNDLRSTNQTFTNFLSKKDIWIDYAYAKFKPSDWLSIAGGRMKVPFWKPKDLVWDEDLYYEGGALNIAFQTEYPVELFMNSAVILLNETALNDNDIFLYIAQPGLKYNITPNIDLRLMGAYYGVNNLKGLNVTGVSGWTNSRETIGANSFLLYDYDAINVNGELGVKKFLPGYVDYVGIYGDYIHSFDAPVLNDGWQAGINFGNAKVVNAGEWQLGYNYRYLGRDAFIALFPDSDFFGGATNVKGHEVELRIGLLKNVNLKLDYYRAREITTNVDEDLMQADFNFSF